MPALFRMQAKRIRESPLSDIFKSRSLAFAEENVAFPLRRIMHITLFRRNIEVSAEKHTLISCTTFIEETAQTPHPSELETIFVRTYELPVRNINVDDAHAFDCRSNQARVRPLFIIRKAAL